MKRMRFSVRELPQRVDTITGNARWALSYVRRYAFWLLIGLIIVSLVQALTTPMLALISRQLIDSIITALNTNGAAGWEGEVLPWLLASLGLALLGQFLLTAKSAIGVRFRHTLHEQLTLEILQHAAILDLKTFEDSQFQDVFQRTQDNSAEHLALFIERIIGTAAAAIEFVGLFVILIRIEPLFLLLITPVIIGYLALESWYARSSFYADIDRLAAYRQTGYYSTNLIGSGNVPEVRIFNIAPVLIQRYQSLIGKVLRDARKLQDRHNNANLVLSTLVLIAFQGAFIRVVQRAMAGAITVGDVVVYAQAALQLNGRTSALSSQLAGAYGETLYVSSLRQFFALRPTIATNSEGRDTDFIPAPPRIVFDQVAFRYPTAEHASLQNLSFHVEPGEIVAIMGSNGAGKTTLVKLLGRLYDPTSGAILIDGVDLRQIPVEAYHRRIAIMFQTYNTYETTVHENIAYGDWDRLGEDPAAVRELVQALDLNIEDFVNPMPQGFETPLGLRFHNRNLSGGQWQKLAIVRTIAKNSPLLILDEPTSSMDAKSEFRLFEYLRATAKQRTTVVISHRFSTLKMADRIIVLDEGRVIEQGTHQELIEREGYYADTFKIFLVK